MQVVANGTRPLLLFLGGTLGLVLFILLAQAATGEGPHEFDNRVLLALRQPDNLAEPVGPGWLLEAMTNLTTLAGWPVLTLFTGLLVGFLVLRRNWRTALLLLAAILGESIMVSALKGVFERARPSVVPHLTESLSYSFPSGHSASAAAIYLTLAAILASRLQRRRERGYVIGSAILIVVIVGFSRVYLGVHYPTDVLAGWSFGAAWASLVLLAARYFTSRPRGGA